MLAMHLPAAGEMVVRGSRHAANVCNHASSSSAFHYTPCNADGEIVLRGRRHRCLGVPGGGDFIPNDCVMKKASCVDVMGWAFGFELITVVRGPVAPAWPVATCETCPLPTTNPHPNLPLLARRAAPGSTSSLAPTWEVRIVAN